MGCELIQLRGVEGMSFFIKKEPNYLFYFLKKVIYCFITEGGGGFYIFYMGRMPYSYSVIRNIRPSILADVIEATLLLDEVPCPHPALVTSILTSPYNTWRSFYFIRLHGEDRCPGHRSGAPLLGTDSSDLPPRSTFSPKT